MSCLEPQILEPAICLGPRHDAFTVLSLEKPEDQQSQMGMEPLQVFQCNYRDFTERIVSEQTSRKSQETEDFPRAPPEHFNGEKHKLL